MPAALLVIDVQKGFDDADCRGCRNNPESEAHVAALLGAWQGPRVYVRHDSDEPGSTGIRISPSGRRRAGSTATSVHEESATVVLTRDAIEERSGNGAA